MGSKDLNSSGSFAKDVKDGVKSKLKEIFGSVLHTSRSDDSIVSVVNRPTFRMMLPGCEAQAQMEPAVAEANDGIIESQVEEYIDTAIEIESIEEMADVQSVFEEMDAPSTGVSDVIECSTPVIEAGMIDMTSVDEADVVLQGQQEMSVASNECNDAEPVEVEEDIFIEGASAHDIDAGSKSREFFQSMPSKPMVAETSSSCCNRVSPFFDYDNMWGGMDSEESNGEIEFESVADSESSTALEEPQIQSVISIVESAVEEVVTDTNEPVGGHNADSLFVSVDAVEPETYSDEPSFVEEMSEIGAEIVIDDAADSTEATFREVAEDATLDYVLDESCMEEVVSEAPVSYETLTAAEEETEIVEEIIPEIAEMESAVESVYFEIDDETEDIMKIIVPEVSTDEFELDDSSSLYLLEGSDEKEDSESDLFDEMIKAEIAVESTFIMETVDDISADYIVNVLMDELSAVAGPIEEVCVDDTQVIEGVPEAELIEESLLGVMLAELTEVVYESSICPAPETDVPEVLSISEEVAIPVECISEVVSERMPCSEATGMCFTFSGPGVSNVGATGFRFIMGSINENDDEDAADDMARSGSDVCHSQDAVCVSSVNNGQRVFL